MRETKILRPCVQPPVGGRCRCRRGPACSQAYQAGSSVVSAETRRPARPSKFGAPCCQRARMPPQLDRQRPCVAAAAFSGVTAAGLLRPVQRSLVLPVPRGKGFLPAIQPDSSPVWWAGPRASGPSDATANAPPPPISSTAATAAVMRWGCFGRFGTGDQAKPGWRWSSRESSSIPKLVCQRLEPGADGSAAWRALDGYKANFGR